MGWSPPASSPARGADRRGCSPLSGRRIKGRYFHRTVAAAHCGGRHCRFRIWLHHQQGRRQWAWSLFCVSPLDPFFDQTASVEAGQAPWQLTQASVCKPSHHLTTGVYQHHPLVNFHLRVSILPGRCEIAKNFRVGGRIIAAAVSLAARFSHPPRGKLQIFATRRLCRYQDYLCQRVSGEIFKFGELVLRQT